MAVSTQEARSRAEAQFELKAGTFTLPVLRLLGTDMDAVARQLTSRVEQASGFFHNAPVVIDLKEVARDDVEVAFPLLVGLMRGLGMLPVGVRGGTRAQQQAAEAMELAVLAEQTVRRQAAEEPPPPAAPVQEPPPPPRPLPMVAPARSLLITRPVRSGQKEYAKGADLIVLAPVSSGAEIMADGNIHVYAPLRGRAMAGAKGNMEARIFCHDLQAELVSIAGYYRVSEDLGPNIRGKAVQVFLKERTLIIEPLVVG